MSTENDPTQFVINAAGVVAALKAFPNIIHSADNILYLLRSVRILFRVIEQIIY